VAVEAVSWITRPFPRQTGHLSQPFKHAFLELRGGRRCLPDHALGAQPRRQELGQDGLGLLLAGKYPNQEGCCQWVIPGRTISLKSWKILSMGSPRSEARGEADA